MSTQKAELTTLVLLDCNTILASTCATSSKLVYSESLNCISYSETVFPTKDSEIPENKTIKIAKIGSEESSFNNIEQKDFVNKFMESLNELEVKIFKDRFFLDKIKKITNKDFRQLASKSYLGRMRGKYLICDYTFDCNNNREFKLPYIKTTYRYSML